jgi:hypothetical protein
MPDPAVRQALDLLSRSHPWHGVALGPEAPRRVTVYLEIVPTDTVKYELDKASGILKVDRPQLFSNVCPSPYGLMPRTLCAGEVAAFAGKRTGRQGASRPGCELSRVYGRDEAFEMIRRSQADYETRFGAFHRALDTRGEETA